MYLIAIIFAWMLSIFATLLLLGAAVGALALVLWLTNRISLAPLRSLARAFAIAFIFTPTIIPYEAEFAQNLGWRDFIFTFGLDIDLKKFTTLYPAGYIFLKGLFTIHPYLLYAGGAPIFMTTAAIWLTTTALQMVWPWINFTAGAFIHLFGWSLHHSASANRHSTMDPIILAILLQLAGLALCLVSAIQGFQRLRQTQNQTPPLTK